MENSSRSDFTCDSIAYGLKEGAFEHLSARDRKRLVRLMARLAEKSYRRGVQHGAQLTEGMPADALARWRFDPSLDRSPFIDSPTVEKSTARLFMEAGELRQLGFAAEEPSL